MPASRASCGSRSLVVLLGDLALRHSAFLRQVYFVGGNEKAARLSGLAVDRLRIVAYVLTGFLAALAGVLLSSRLMSGMPTAGNALELQVLAACVIGGASLRGGEGTVLGAFLGVIFVALVNNAMTMLAVSIYWQMIVTGAVLVAAVALDMLVRAPQQRILSKQGGMTMTSFELDRRGLLGLGAAAAGLALAGLPEPAAAQGAGGDYVFLSIVTQVPFWADHRQALEDVGQLHV